MMFMDGFPSFWALRNSTTPTARGKSMDEASTDQTIARRSTAPTSFFRVPELFVRLSSKGRNVVDPESVWSPTSPLDFKNLSSNIGITNLRCPGSPGVGANAKLRTSPPRVGLGLVDVLAADESSQFGRRNSILESIRPFLELGLPACSKLASANGSLDEIAQSEEYTCVIERGPNPRTTHILGDETLEICISDCNDSTKCSFIIESLEEPSQPPSTLVGVAAGFCCHCSKRLQEDRDIYMYLGEKAFCSSECRKSYIEEEIEELGLMVVDSESSLFLGED